MIYKAWEYLMYCAGWQPLGTFVKTKNNNSNKLNAGKKNALYRKTSSWWTKQGETDEETKKEIDWLAEVFERVVLLWWMSELQCERRRLWVKQCNTLQPLKVQLLMLTVSQLPHSDIRPLLQATMTIRIPTYKPNLVKITRQSRFQTPCLKPLNSIMSSLQNSRA